MTQLNRSGDSLPEVGSVLGVDVGWSEKRRSSAVCRLDWTAVSFSWQIDRFRAVDEERLVIMKRVLDRPVLAAAIDGPLRRGFGPIEKYRETERILTKLQPYIGKPGQASSPNGIALNNQANLSAWYLRARGLVGQSTHRESIDTTAILEAFPTSFLGVMLERPGSVAVKRGKRSDAYFRHLASKGRLDDLVGYLLAGREAAQPLEGVMNHDDRAALVCALTALCLASGNYSAVGDEDGWIILPPVRFIQPWAYKLLQPHFESGGFVWRHSSVAKAIGCLDGKYPAMPLEELNSSDAEVAKLFYGDAAAAEDLS